jgi:16S rRNA (guanine966-N2)-methyltransferase
MRVIAGSAKGRRLQAPETSDTRPLTDRAKEALFSALGDRVAGAQVLDLYAGSGSIGIEALSRGAAQAVFVEKGRKALDALRRNLNSVGFASGVVVGQSVEAYLASARTEFDLVFCDPPWAMTTEEVEEVMEAVDRITAPGAEFIVQRRAPDREPVPAPGWRHVTTRRYGDAKICRYVKEPK